MLNSNKHARAIAASLTKRYLDADLSEIRLIEGRGEVNQVYELLVRHKKAILRINDRTEFARYQKEQWCMDAARAKGVPTPQILHVGRDDECAYMLLQLIEGSNGADITDTNDTWYMLGKHLSQIHSISVAGFGDNLSDITLGAKTQWQDYLKSNIQALSDERLFVRHGLLTNLQAATLQNSFKNLTGKHFTFGLNHGDYKLANIIMSNKDTAYVIDWGSAQAHIVPHYDLAVMLGAGFSADSEKYLSVLSGYGMTGQSYLQIYDDILVLQLLEAVDKVRWAVEKAPHRLQHYTKQLTDLVMKSKF